MGQIRAETLREDGRVEVARVFDVNPVKGPDGPLAAGSEDEIVQDP